MAKSNKEQKFPAEHTLSLNSSADHSTLLQNEEEEHGSSELQQSVCLSQCNVTQIENLLACRISCERFSGCKSREQSTAVGKTFRRPPCIQVCRLQSEQSTTQSSSFRLYPPYALSLTPVYSLFLHHFSTFITQCSGSSPCCSVHRNSQDFAWF
jgi:hypothetical protein